MRSQSEEVGWPPGRDGQPGAVGVRQEGAGPSGRPGCSSSREGSAAGVQFILWYERYLVKENYLYLTNILYKHQLD